MGSGVTSEDVCRHVAVGSQLFHHQRLACGFYEECIRKNIVQDEGEI